MGLYAGDQAPLDANFSATATMPDATASMGQHCDDVIAGVPDHSFQAAYRCIARSLEVVRTEDTSATHLGLAADSVVIEVYPGSSSSGLSLQLNLACSPPSCRPVTAPSILAPSLALHAPFAGLLGIAESGARASLGDACHMSFRRAEEEAWDSALTRFVVLGRRACARPCARARPRRDWRG